MNTISMPAAITIFGLVALVAAAGFAGWIANGGGAFMALADNGLSWCL